MSAFIDRKYKRIEVIFYDLFEENGHQCYLRLIIRLKDSL
jgi:hypothetical protein